MFKNIDVIFVPRAVISGTTDDEIKFLEKKSFIIKIISIKLNIIKAEKVVLRIRIILMVWILKWTMDMYRVFPPKTEFNTLKMRTSNCVESEYSTVSTWTLLAASSLKTRTINVHKHLQHTPEDVFIWKYQLPNQAFFNKIKWFLHIFEQKTFCVWQGWGAGAGAAWEKIGSRSRLKKKSGAEAGAAKKFAGSPALLKDIFQFICII